MVIPHASKIAYLIGKVYVYTANIDYRFTDYLLPMG